MTTIAYRDGVLAADGLACREGVRTGIVTKIFAINGGSMLALMGDAPSALSIMRWIEADKVGDQPEGDGAVVEIRPSGEVIVYENGNHGPAGDAPFYAWGCGFQLAMGAMAMGATAEQALAVAVEYDTYTGGKITVLRGDAH